VVFNLVLEANKNEIWALVFFLFLCNFALE